VVKHPEFELYHTTKDPWELNNLAGKSKYAKKVKAMHALLREEMVKLDDHFSTIDPKDAKRANKGKPSNKDRPNKKK
jgi:hypothetical protein